MMRGYDGSGLGAWFAMAFVMLMFWAIVVSAVVIAVRSGRSHSAGDGQPAVSGPERILAERFARGEIDADEYTRRRDLLRSR
jgi:putative membrane protein